MIHLRRAAEHFQDDIGWLSTTHHFSFNEYYDPGNVSWGTLRVFNDDTIQPAAGFPLHPHSDMEIVTYVLRGTLRHEDSMGNKGDIGAGEVQRMSAGKGVFHAEFNASKTDDVHLLQMWVLPSQRGLTPSWEQKSFAHLMKKNELTCIVSPDGKKDSMKIHQDASFYVSTLTKGSNVSLPQPTQGRFQFVFVVDGEVEVNGHVMRRKDAARVLDESELSFVARENAHFVVWDMGAADDE